MRPGRSNRKVEGVDGFAALLKRAGVDFAAEDLADALWLAGQMGGGAAKQTLQREPEQAGAQPEIREEFLESEDDLEADGDQLPLTLPSNDAGAEGDSPSPEGISIKAPAAPALRIKLDLARALRPLRRKVPAPGPRVFDEAATVAQIAEQQIWSPVMSPAPERWLDLALVVEDSASLVLWRETIREFQGLVERQGAFRRVTTWRLAGRLTGDGTEQKLGLFPHWAVKPKPGEPSRKAEQLLDPGGRRLILLLSDCTSAAWHSGAMLDWLETWGKQAPMAVVQFLPERLWAQTALGRGVPVWLRGMEQGMATGQLRRQYRMPMLQQLLALAEVEPEVRSEKITVPVVTLEVEPLKQWARMVAGWGESRAVGVELERGKFGASKRPLPQPLIPRLGEGSNSRSDGSTSDSPSPSIGGKGLGDGGKRLSNSAQAVPSAEERVQRFRGTASLLAQRLAGLMAAVPVEPVVVDLIRQTLLREAEPVHVAEVYMGGLMEASGDGTGDGELSYEFPQRVRALLVDGVPRSRTLAVLDAVSAYISERLRLSTRSFEALLCSNWAELEGEGEVMVAPFARVAAKTLARLGGEYAGLARRVQAGAGGAALPPTVDEPGDVFPLLQSFRFREATLRFSDVEDKQLRKDSDQVLVEDSHCQEFIHTVAARRQLSATQARLLALVYCKRISLKQTALALYGTASKANAVSKHLARIYVIFGISGGTKGKRRQLKESLDRSFKHWEKERAITKQSGPTSSSFTEKFIRDLAQRHELSSIQTSILSQKFSDVVHRYQEHTAQFFSEEALWLELGQLVLEMVQIPSGSFMMGSPEDELGRADDEGPEREVIIAEPFFLGKYPVTQTQWRAVAELPQVERELESTPSDFEGGNRPVEQVSWLDAVEFCKRLAKATRRPYRLPSEAEWEYACRAGTASPFHFGASITTNLANYRGTDWKISERTTYSGAYGDGPHGEYREQTTDVGQFDLANAFGLCDMHGNVWEWCQDRWHSSYEGAPTDGSAWVEPSADEDEEKLVLRGGSWFSNPEFCRSASRFRVAPAYKTYLTGFRVCCGVVRQ